MSLTNTYAWNATRDDIIKRALRIVKALDQRATPSTEQTNNAIFALNAMVNSWKARGVFLWTLEELTIPFQAATIVNGTDGQIYECIRNHTSASGNKPVTGSDYTSYWIPSGATGIAWASGQSYIGSNNYALSAEIIGIEENGIFVRRGVYDSKVELISRDIYMGMGDKYVKGLPTHVWFERQSSPQIFIYPIPDTITDVLHCTVVRRAMDVSTSDGTTNLDFTTEWIEALSYGLAATLTLEYEVSPNERAFIDKKAKETFDIVWGNDTEKAGIRFYPDRRR